MCGSRGLRPPLFHAMNYYAFYAINDRAAAFTFAVLKLIYTCLKLEFAVQEIFKILIFIVNMK